VGSRVPDIGADDVRRLVVETCGYDPGPIAAATRLADAQLVGCNAVAVLAALEERYRIDHFPADLCTSLETVDDLVYFTNTKRAHGLGA
jgi:acyl carrier protein